MKALIIYDSTYGNTEKIARTIANTISNEVKVLRVTEVNPSTLESIDLLIVGSPTHGGGPTPAIKDFVNQLAEPFVKGIKVAAFDTRLTWRWVRIFGFAAEKIANELKRKGGTLVVPPAGFFVKGTGKEDSVINEELERVVSWVTEITSGSLRDTVEQRNGTDK